MSKQKTVLGLIVLSLIVLMSACAPMLNGAASPEQVYVEEEAARDAYYGDTGGYGGGGLPAEAPAVMPEGDFASAPGGNTVVTDGVAVQATMAPPPQDGESQSQQVERMIIRTG